MGNNLAALIKIAQYNKTFEEDDQISYSIGIKIEDKYRSPIELASISSED